MFSSLYLIFLPPLILNTSVVVFVTLLLYNKNFTTELLLCRTYTYILTHTRTTIVARTQVASSKFCVVAATCALICHLLHVHCLHLFVLFCRVCVCITCNWKVTQLTYYLRFYAWAHKFKCSPLKFSPKKRRNQLVQHFVATMQVNMTLCVLEENSKISQPLLY